MTKNTDEITREYFNSILVAPSYLDAAEADTSVELFGEKFETPITTTALSHLKCCENAMAEYGLGAGNAGALHFMGMGEDKELEGIIATGAKTVKIIKPHADNKEVFRRIEHAIKAGAFGVGMDIDHAISHNGGYDNVLGLPMAPKSTEELKEFVAAAGNVPFIVKGVLSVSDTVKCVEAGAAAVIVSHHHGIMETMTPPLMVLPEIVKAAEGRLKVFLDCGVETGMDVFKALALGADAVGVGRALMGPLEQGHAGVEKRMREMNGELKCVMARTGARTIKDIDPSVLRFRDFWRKPLNF